MSTLKLFFFVFLQKSCCGYTHYLCLGKALLMSTTTHIFVDKLQKYNQSMAETSLGPW